MNAWTNKLLIQVLKLLDKLTCYCCQQRSRLSPRDRHVPGAVIKGHCAGINAKKLTATTKKEAFGEQVDPRSQSSISST